MQYVSGHSHARLRVTQLQQGQPVLRVERHMREFREEINRVSYNKMASSGDRSIVELNAGLLHRR